MDVFKFKASISQISPRIQMAPLLYTNAAGGTLLEPIMNMSNLPTPNSKCFFEFLTKSIESNFRIEIEPHLIPQSARCTDIVAS